jgi:hypothetical protein
MMVQLPPNINQTQNQSKVLETHPEAYPYAFFIRYRDKHH